MIVKIALATLATVCFCLSMKAATEYEKEASLVFSYLSNVFLVLLLLC